MTSRTRYFERATLCLFVKEAYVKGVVDLVLVSTVEEVADIFTKALDATTFNKMKAYIFNVADKVMAERGMKLWWENCSLLSRCFRGDVRFPNRAWRMHASFACSRAMRTHGWISSAL